MLGGGREGCPGPQGGAWLAGWHCPALGVVSSDSWQWQKPALSVWLSPDTRGPATKEPRQNNLAGGRGGQGQRVRAAVCSGPWGRGGGGWALSNWLPCLPRGQRCLEGFSRKRFYSDMSLCPLRVTSSLLRRPAGPTVPSFGPQRPCWHCQQTSRSPRQPAGPAHATHRWVPHRQRN